MAAGSSPNGRRYWTVSVTLVECLRLPLVPEIVSFLVPLPVLVVVVIVRVDLPLPPETELGLNEAVARLGRLPTLSDTDPVNPFDGVIVTV